MRTNADIAGYKPDVSGTINLNNGSTISLSTSDFVSNSLTIRTSTSTGEFSIGSVAIGGISFVLLNDTGKFSGIDWYDSTVDLTLTVNETQIQLGRHWIANHNETGWMISVECHDVTHVLDKFNVGNLGLSFPCTVQDVLTAFTSFYAEQDHNYGITFDTTAIASMLSVSIPEVSGEMTQRAFLSYIAQICGSFVRTHGTTLKFAWYDISNKYSAGTTFSHSLRMNDVQFKLVKVVDTDGGIEIQRVGTNTSGETITVEDNPLITPDNLSVICSRLSAALDGLVYRPGDITIKSHAGVEAGDVLLVSTGQEQNITVLAMNVTYKLQLTEQVSADVSQYEGDLRKNAAGYARQVANDTVDEALANITNGTQEIYVEPFGLTNWALDNSYRATRISILGGDPVPWMRPADSTTQYHADISAAGQWVTIPTYGTIAKQAQERGVAVSDVKFKMKLEVRVKGRDWNNVEGSTGLGHQTTDTYYIFELGTCVYEDPSHILLLGQHVARPNKDVLASAPDRGWFYGWDPGSGSSLYYYRFIVNFAILPGTGLYLNGSTWAWEVST